MGKSHRKSKNSRPWLTKKDKTIYNVLIVLSMALPLLLAIFYLIAKDRIAYTVAGTVAYANDYRELLTIPFWMFIIFCPFILLETLKTSRVPIFGNQKIKYVWGEEPIFAKKTRPMPQKKKRRVVTVAAILCTVFVLLTALAFPWLYTRTTITEDMHLHEYNAFNIETKDRPLAQSEAVSLKIFYEHPRNSAGYWTLLFTVQPENMKFRLDGCVDLDHMLDLLEVLKAALPAENFTVIGAENAAKLIADQDLTTEQAARLYALIATSTP